MLMQTIAMYSHPWCLDRGLRPIALLVRISFLFLVAGSVGAQPDPCQAFADYEVAKKTAIAAQEEFQKHKLSKGAEKILVEDPTDRAEKLPEQKIENSMERIRRSIEKYESLPKKKRAGFEVAFTQLARHLAELEAWLKARKKRDEADRNLEAAKVPYSEAINAKDEALKNARATFDNEQAHIGRVRARLEGRSQDEAYKREVTELLTRTRAAYERMLEYLSTFDCFVDVRNFMDDLKERIRKIDANVDTVRDFDPADLASPAPAPAVVTKDSSDAGLLTRIAGLWRDSDTGSLIEIRPGGTAVLTTVSEASARRGYKRGDVTFSGLRAVGVNTLEATMTTRAPIDPCPALGPKTVKASLKVNASATSLSGTAPSIAWELSDGSPCRWTNRVYETISFTLTRLK